MFKENKLFIILITLISFIAIISFLFSPFFRINTLEFQGLITLKEEEVEEIIKQLGHRLVNKFLHQPTVGLKELAVENKEKEELQLEAAKKIFAVGQKN